MSHSQQDPVGSDADADALQDDPEAAGGMGVSSERPGSVRGQDTAASVASAPTHTDDETGVGSNVAEGERPDEVESTRDFDPGRNPRHG